MKWSFGILVVICISCNSNTYQKPVAVKTDTIVKEAVNTPVTCEFLYDGITFNVSGHIEKKAFKGKIRFLTNEIDIFNGNDGEKYFIDQRKKDKNSLLFSTHNNQEQKATIKVHVTANKTNFEADFGNTLAQFHLVKGELSDISIYSSDTAKTADKSLYNWNKEYESSKYKYKIKIPETYSKVKGNRPHIDLKFADKFGSSILVNVSPRQQDEYNITAHDYTKDMLEQSFKQGAPNVVITYTEKLIVSGEKAFLIEYENGYPNMKSMECYFYHNDYAFVLTCACEKSKFSNYKQLFKNSINSFSF